MLLGKPELRKTFDLRLKFHTTKSIKVMTLGLNVNKAILMFAWNSLEVSGEGTGGHNAQAQAL